MRAEQGKGIKPKGTALEFAKMNGHSGTPKMGVQDGSFLDCLVRSPPKFPSLSPIVYAPSSVLP